MSGVESISEKTGSAALLGIGISCFLAAVKFAAGIFGGSQAMIADAVESSSDVLTTSVVYVSFRISRKPVDWDHPFGHGRAESIAMAIVAVFVAGAGLGMGVRVVMRLSSGQPLEPPGMIALAGAFFTIAIKEVLYRYFTSLAKTLKNSLLQASAIDHRKDVIGSLATIAGILGARLGFPILDPVAALFVSVLILGLAYEIGKEALQELMDRAPDTQIISRIIDVALECRGVEHAFVRARRLGSSFFIEVKIDIDPNLTVAEGHLMAKDVKNAIFVGVENTADVLVHVNPHED